MAQKAGFCPQKRAESGICGSSRRDLPTCASACVIERKRRLSRGSRRSGESCGALFGRYDLLWWRALTQKYFDGRELCGGLTQAISARVEQRTRRFALGRDYGDGARSRAARRLPPHDRGGKLQNGAQRARYSPVFVKESKLDFSPEHKAAVEIRRQKRRRTMFRKNNNIARIESAFSRQAKKR